MNIHDLSVNQLKRAAVIKEQIERLNKELSVTLGAPQNPGLCARRIGQPNQTASKGFANCRSVKLNGAIAVSRAVCEHNRPPQYRNQSFAILNWLSAVKPQRFIGSPHKLMVRSADCFRARAYAPTCRKGDA
jgi:hypothetical protein